ncbi:hypothetical protein BDU57DRAFT_525776 [Ampelomyces quisqualis]|uniref:Uncharacterized protein n=1 Tax=Ampelomyces quisqualis TaxID=50730 RepID=A0A6A5R495_AMPQU|nr:hypothetical protein BDU57DRAFT_525776 [Ampelomyces quisqualis]
MANPYLVKAIYDQLDDAAGRPQRVQQEASMSIDPPARQGLGSAPSRNILYTPPTLQTLREASIYIANASGKRIKVSPAEELRYAVTKYFPIPGFYYDQAHLPLHFGPDYFKTSGTGAKCTCCWKARHFDRNRLPCRKLCSICRTQEHSGKECPKLFVDVCWWANHGRGKLDPKTPVNPTACERAHLVVAGILKDWKTFDEPIILNLDHPLVKAHYEGKALPQYIDPPPAKEERAQTLGNRKRKVPFDETSDDSVEEGEIVSEDVERQVESIVLNAQQMEEDSLFVPENSPRESDRVAELEEKLAQAKEELGKMEASFKAREKTMARELAQAKDELRKTKAALKGRNWLVEKMVNESQNMSSVWGERARRGREECQ